MPTVTDRYGVERYINPNLVEHIEVTEMKVLTADKGRAKKNPDGTYSVESACVVKMSTGVSFDFDGSLQSVVQTLKVP